MLCTKSKKSGDEKSTQVKTNRHVKKKRRRKRKSAEIEVPASKKGKDWFQANWKKCLIWWTWTAILSLTFFYSRYFSKWLCRAELYLKRFCEELMEITTYLCFGAFFLKRKIFNGGQVLTVGCGDTGQLGLGPDVEEKTRPSQVTSLSPDIVAVAAGGLHSICLTKDGKIFSWGCNDEGGLGRLTTDEEENVSAGEISTHVGSTAVQISAGDCHSAALTSEGSVYAWGSFRDNNGPLGLILRGTIQKTPIKLNIGEPVKKIASGDNHLVLLTESGLLLTFGCGESDQLGRLAKAFSGRERRNRNTEHLLVPMPVNVFKSCKRITFDNVWAGGLTTFARSSDGFMYAFGLNNYNQLGLLLTLGCGESGQLGRLAKAFSGRERRNRNTEHLLVNVFKSCKRITFDNVWAGGLTTFARSSDGFMYAFGLNNFNQLGLLLTLGCGESGQLGRLAKAFSGRERRNRNTEHLLVNVFKSCKRITFDNVWAGGLTTFARSSDGFMYAFGLNNFNQLGLLLTLGCGESGQLGRLAKAFSGRERRNRNTEHLLVNVFKSCKRITFDNVWAGGLTTFARSSDGFMYAFGLNNFNQLGHSDTNMKFQPVIIPELENFVHVSPGQHHSLALDAEGAVYVMGRGEYGRLGLGDTSKDASTPTQITVPTKHKIKHVAAGECVSFCVTEHVGSSEDAEKPPNKRNIFDIELIGEKRKIKRKPEIEQLFKSMKKRKFDDLDTDSSPKQITQRFSPTLQPPAKTSRHKSPIKMEEVAEKAFFLQRKIFNGGQVLTVGCGDTGQLGLGPDVEEKTRPSQVTSLSPDIVAVAAGGLHSICLTKDGKIFSWGCNDEGGLGRLTTDEEENFSAGEINTQVGSTAVQISAGDCHSAALTSDGSVYAWGSFRDNNGLLGLILRGTIEKTPIKLNIDEPVKKISSGDNHLVLLTESGLLLTLGCGESGQLGRVAEAFFGRERRNRNTEHLLVPMPVNVFKSCKRITFDNVWAGGLTTFARSSDGFMYAFGLNNFNQLGHSDTNMKFQPVIIPELENFVHVSPGQHHSLALDAEGAVYVMGRGDYGRLGLGDTSKDASTPTQITVPTKHKIKHVAAGECVSFCVTENGEAFGFGMGTNNQLAQGHDEDKLSPTPLKGKQLKNKKIVSIEAGGQHTIILAVPT